MKGYARSIRVRGIVQGVGFRPFVFRLARKHDLGGWILNTDDGVEIHVEGADEALNTFTSGLRIQAPSAARVATIEVLPAAAQGFQAFEIMESAGHGRPTVRISPDLAVCADCLCELFDPRDRRYGYPYINCTSCGPRFSILLGLPYDRPRTTMRAWPMCAACAREYGDPRDRRFHAQPVACWDCGPRYQLTQQERVIARDRAAAEEAARALRAGAILAVKGLGGYHLACDAANAAAVGALRERKYRKEKPFAVMTRDLETARALVTLSPESEKRLASPVRPIVLAPGRVELAGAAPENSDLGVMLPYAPLHHLLFAAGAPAVLVMTSGNRSSEPIAYEDEDARERLAGVVDVILAGERPIARRLEDPVVRAGAFGPVVLRRGRGDAPGAVTRLPAEGPVLAVGADLKNSVTLVVEGEAFVSQHIGDLEHYQAFRAFQAVICDLTAMYAVDWGRLTVVYDLHPQYASTAHALTLPARRAVPVQHHRAHVASVLAEYGALDQRVLGIAFDGTGYGDDGGIWGGEFFVGSVREGFDRVARLQPAPLPGGDAAARYPVQAAAGFLARLTDLPDLTASPFHFPARYRQAQQLVARGLRTFQTTSAGRLFDAVAALLGFTREITFEGQAAIWLEHLARSSDLVDPYPVVFDRGELDARAALAAIIDDRRGDRPSAAIARAFHRGLARGVADAAVRLCEAHRLDTVVLSGGVFQNDLLLQDVTASLAPSNLQIWTNHQVPPNDGGISLGQAALAAVMIRSR